MPGDDARILKYDRGARPRLKVRRTSRRREGIVIAMNAHFGPELFEFLRQLRQNNNRDWFQANKHRYEDHVKRPLLRFIEDFGPELEAISPHFVADPRGNGGSMFRIYRDVRFSKDKSPYKTQAAAQFRHEFGKSAHAPGFYLHLAPDEVFAGIGLWGPDTPTLTKIREAIVADPGKWRSVVSEPAFAESFDRHGRSLKRPPQGIPERTPAARGPQAQRPYRLDAVHPRADLPARFHRSLRRRLPPLLFLHAVPYPRRRITVLNGRAARRSWEPNSDQPGAAAAGWREQIQQSGQPSATSDTGQRRNPGSVLRLAPEPRSIRDAKDRGVANSRPGRRACRYAYSKPD